MIIGNIDTYDYEQYYFNNFGRREERLLTKDELHILYFVCEIAVENKLDFILGFSASSESYCIHKTPQNEWVISDCGERRDGYIYGVFDNIYDACILLIQQCANDKNKASAIINDFNDRLNKKIGEEELENFVCSRGYYDQFFYDDFCYIIKKISGIDVDDDALINERIINRTKRDFPTTTDFNYLLTIFVDNIAKKLNIDTKDIYDRWHYGEIDYETYQNQKLERINLKSHKDLVLNELEKYNKSLENKIKKLKNEF